MNRPNQKQWEKAKEDYLNGKSVVSISEKLGIDRISVYNHARRHNWSKKEGVISKFLRRFRK